jgi:hypothetical protein
VSRESSRIAPGQLVFGNNQVHVLRRRYSQRGVDRTRYADVLIALPFLQESEDPRVG